VTEDQDRARNAIQVIARAAHILRIIAKAPQGLSLADIAREAKLARSTVQRIVTSLADEAFVQPASSRGGIVLGDGLLKLIVDSEIDTVGAIQPLLRQLSMDIGETVDLSVLNGSAALFIEHIPGSHRLAALSAIGTEFPLHSTANGKALLTCAPLNFQTEYLSGPLAQFTRHTVTSAQVLQGQLRQIASTGLAHDLEEHTEGVCALGTAFLDSAGRAYAVSIPVPRQRFDEKQAQLEAALLSCRTRIVATISGSVPGE
jgi:DNA-binding IclR family transcriptional regulator